VSELIRLDDVRKIYRMGSEEVGALDGVSLTFSEGSFWAFMGPSGSGKSTLLNPPLVAGPVAEERSAEGTDATTATPSTPKASPPAGAKPPGQERPAAGEGEGAPSGGTDWRSMTPEERRKRWESMTPEEQQAARERMRGRSGGNGSR